MRGLRRGWLHRNPAPEHTALHPSHVSTKNAFGAASASARRISTEESGDLFYSRLSDSSDIEDKGEEWSLIGLLMAVHLVCYAGIARPGHSYSMSSSYWVNTGTEPETFVFRADPPAGASWIKMAESSVTLDPGQAVSIPVTLAVPVGAAKGIYGARLEASGAEESVEFGVGVRPGCAGPAAPPLVPGGGRGFPLPLWVVTGLLLTAALLTWLARQRRTDCDHPVHRLRGGKWQNLTLRDMLRVAGEPGSRPRGSCR